jgi:hypothetical protein
MVDHFFAKYGGDSLLDLLDEVGVSAPMVISELKAFLPRLLEHAQKTGFLEQRIRAHSDASIDRRPPPRSSPTLLGDAYADWPIASTDSFRQFTLFGVAASADRLLRAPPSARGFASMTHGLTPHSRLVRLYGNQCIGSQRFCLTYNGLA